MNRRRLAALTLLTASVVAPACGSNDGRTSNADSPTTKAENLTTPSTEDVPTTTLPTVTTVVDPATAHPAIAASLGFWTRYIEMTGRPGPFDPTSIRAELDQFTTGAETSKLFEFIQGNMLAGRVLRGTVEHSPRLDAVTDETATVIDCLVDGTGIYSADGSRADSEDLRPHPATLGLRLVDGVWKVETVAIGSEICEP